MRTLRAFVSVAVVGLLVAGALQAQTATGSVLWKGTTGAWGSYNNSGTGGALWNVYTSPYRAQFKIPTNPTPALLPPAGTSSFGPTWDIYCVDFNHIANTSNSGYGAFFTNLADARTNPSWLGKYTRNTDITRYLAAAYLAGLIRAKPDSAGILNGAIWQIMSGQPNYWWTGHAWQDVSGWATYALETGYLGVNAANWVVVTDRSGYINGTMSDKFGTQEYLTQVTPEPATLLLLGTGLVVMLMAAAAFRRPTV